MVISAVSQTITRLRRAEAYRKDLVEKKFTVSVMKDGRVGMKLGKKADVAIAPDRQTAERFVEILNRMMALEAERIEIGIVHLSAGVEQLSISFDEEVPAPQQETLPFTQLGAKFGGLNP